LITSPIPFLSFPPIKHVVMVIIKNYTISMFMIKFTFYVTIVLILKYVIRRKM
jgi:hypothetical protein